MLERTGDLYHPARAKCSHMEPYHSKVGHMPPHWAHEVGHVSGHMPPLRALQLHKHLHREVVVTCPSLVLYMHGRVSSSNKQSTEAGFV